MALIECNFFSETIGVRSRAVAGIASSRAGH